MILSFIALLYIIITYYICIRLRRIPIIFIILTYLLVLLGAVWCQTYVTSDSSPIRLSDVQFLLSLIVVLSIVMPLVIWFRLKLMMKFRPWMFERSLKEYERSILGFDKIFYYIKHYEHDTVKLLFILYPPVSLFFIDLIYVSRLVVSSGFVNAFLVFIALIPAIFIVFYVFLSVYFNVRILDVIYGGESTRDSKL